MLCPQLSVTNLENPHLTIVTQSHSELDIDEQIKNSEKKNQEVQVYVGSQRTIQLSSYQFQLNFCSVSLLKARTLLRYAEGTGDITKEIKTEIK